MTRKVLLAALALACAIFCIGFPVAAFASEAQFARELIVRAAEVVTAPAATAVVLPWGDWIVAIGQAVTAVLLPILVGLISLAVYQVAPWAMLFLTQKRIEQMAEAMTDYALNAVGGVAKGQQLTIPVGSAVIAKAVQRAIDVAPAKVIAAAGGPQGHRRDRVPPSHPRA